MIKKIAIGIGILAVIIIFYMLDLKQYLNIETLVDRRDDLLLWVEEYFILSYLAYILGYILIITFSLPGAAISSITGGLLFGLIPGLIASNIAATLGATINFLFARYVFGNSLQTKYADKLEKFNKEMQDNGVSYMLMLRLIPIFPFFLINLLAGLTKLRFSTFIWTTMVGIIPGSIFYIYAGTTLKLANSVGDIITVNTLIPLFLLGLVAFLPVVYNKNKKKKALIK